MESFSADFTTSLHFRKRIMGGEFDFGMESQGRNSILKCCLHWASLMHLASPKLMDMLVTMKLVGAKLAVQLKISAKPTADTITQHA